MVNIEDEAFDDLLRGDDNLGALKYNLDNGTHFFCSKANLDPWEGEIHQETLCT